MTPLIITLGALFSIAFVGLLVQLVRTLAPVTIGYRKANLDEQGRRLEITMGRFLWSLGWYGAVLVLGFVAKVLAMVLS